jgi:hypothetical protein
MARQFWPNDDAIGARLSLGSKTASESSATDPKTLEIVGVAGDVRERTDRSTDPRRNTIYIPVAQNSDGFTAYILRNPAIWMIRTRVEPHSLEQRAKEIGIRIALGASNVQTMVIRQGMQLVLVGTAIGVAAALGLTRFLASFLYGVAALDPAVFIAVPILLAAVALAAIWLPARRASRVDPIQALRCE